jgi:hypothetical protein
MTSNHFNVTKTEDLFNTSCVIQGIGLNLVKMDEHLQYSDAAVTRCATGHV